MSESPPNIVWLTVDSIRADHTSMAGYRRDTTPELGRIAGEDGGQWFGNCFAHSTSTRTSTTTILTGTVPPYHQTSTHRDDAVPDGLETIPERLSTMGYRTAALSVNTHFSPATNLDRGFDDFLWISPSTLWKLGLRTLLKYALNVRRHSAGFTLDSSKHSTQYLLAEKIGQWLDDLERGAEPYFLYVHFNGPHGPYYPPAPYRDEYTDELEVSGDEAAAFALHAHRNIIHEGEPLSDEDLVVLQAMYDAEIRYTDAILGRIFDANRDHFDGGTALVVTGDHGEAFDERGFVGHGGHPDDPQLHVPLVTYGLDELDHQSDGFVQHVDLVKTLLGIVGAETANLHGVDLRTRDREYVFGHQLADARSAIRDEAFKLERDESEHRLYSLPDEREVPADAHVSVVERLSGELDAWLESVGTPEWGTTEVELTGAMEKQLRDLGYID